MRTSGSPDRTAELRNAGEVDRTGSLRAVAEESGRRSRRRGRALTRRCRNRSPRPKEGKRRGLRRLLTWRKALAALVTVCALLTGAFAVLYTAIDIPRANDLAKAQSNVYLFSDGSRLARTGEINRETVPIDRVPENVRLAFVAAENKDFYTDSGVSFSGTARGILNTVTGRGTQGGSTITQQYVKNYYLSQEQTVTRKVKELIISLKVDQRNSKSDILAGYLNSSYYGRQAYGIQAAARAYYHREVERLTVEQGAYLAALLQAPSQYDWAIAGPEGKRLVTQRWNYVLDNMVGQGWLDKTVRGQMKFPVPVAGSPTAGLSGQTGYLVEAARRELMASGVSEQELAGGGWRITLTVDPRKQKALEKTVSAAGGAPGGPALDKNIQAGAVSMDPRNGHVVALYGGRDYMRQYISNATRADYQVGPLFEPVAVAASMEAKAGERPPADDDAVVDTANALGMDLKPSDVASPKALSLGLMGASPLKIAGVYAAFRHDGKKVTPSIVKSAQRDGEVTPLPDPVGGSAISSLAADTVTDVLSRAPGRRDAVPSMWTEDGRQEVVQKSGRSDDGKAEWFVGSTEELLTTIGLFGENATTHKQIPLPNAGEGHPAGMWMTYTQTALGGGEAYFPGVAPEPTFG
ncbi:transglycosylase domain-containing protein [Streptomyces sp. NPDC096193]|uniref:transglycosylase domain-containing protein n=1 Tax=Streptomyces sp. NPDC096193 TaxID=3155821 RepID=UPI003319A153